MGYPGLVSDEAGEAVSGYIFSADGLVDFWPALDEFEGAQYVRVLVDAYLDDGNSVEAFVYVLR